MPNFTQRANRTAAFTQEANRAVNFNQEANLSANFNQEVDTNVEDLADYGSVILDEQVRPMINVLFPPTGYTALNPDGSTDNAAAFQAMIDADLGDYYFPPPSDGGYGVYAFESPIQVANKYGFSIIGGGQPRMSVLGNATFEGTGAALAAGPGLDGGNLIEYEGSDFYLRNIGLWGKLNSSQSEQAAYGIRLIKGTGVGTGKIDGSSVRYESFSTASIGTTDSSNCDMVSMRRMTSRDCGAHLYTENDQAMLYKFDHLQGLGMTNGFDLNGGGQLVVDGMNWVNTGTFFKDRGMGGNNIPCVFRNVHFDAQSDGTELFNFDNNAGTAIVIFKNCFWPTSTDIDHTGVVDRTTGNAMVGIEFDSCTIGATLEGNLDLVANTNRYVNLLVRGCFIGGTNNIDSWVQNTSKFVNGRGYGNYRGSGDDWDGFHRDIAFLYNWNSVFTRQEMYGPDHASAAEVWEDTTP